MDNYALWLLKNALRDEVTFRQQALEVLDGIQGLHSAHREKSLDVFSESLSIADKRIPQLINAINAIETKT